jgi:hypothetical protein
MDPIPETDNAIPPRRSPDGDLAFAFFGSIVVGLVTPVMPYLLYQWRPGLLVLFSILGGFVGFLWGYLTVIVAAAAGCEKRRAATLGMFTILCLGLLLICWFCRGVADF